MTRSDEGQQEQDVGEACVWVAVERLPMLMLLPMVRVAWLPAGV